MGTEIEMRTLLGPLYVPKTFIALLTIACFGYGGMLGFGKVRQSVEGSPPFDGEQAFMHVEQQLNFGPRLTGTIASRRFRNWLEDLLDTMGWQVFTHSFPIHENGTGVNVIAMRGSGPELLLGAHYDSRLWADEDPSPVLRERPVPGANDGASGVAVLLELARVLDVAGTGHTICLAFFDAEDNGNIPGWFWIMGSQAFADDLKNLPKCQDPQVAIIIDMVGDHDQLIYQERNGTAGLSTAIWKQAAELGYDQYLIPEAKYALIDDHIPFLRKGIPAITIIDFDYPYWHTVSDTLDKISPESLERVGLVLEAWLENGAEWSESAESAN